MYNAQIINKPINDVICFFLSHQGSAQPTAPNDNQLVLYSMRFCPFAHRTHLVLNIKNIPYHVFYINLSEKPEWYSKVNPNGKVPALHLVNEKNQPFLIESMTICEYLDEKYPDIKLYPTDPLEKAETKLWIDRFSSITGTYYRLIYEKNSEEVKEKLLNDLFTGLNPYEEELKKRGTQFFGGDKPSIFDYGIWPWFERFGVLPAVVGDKFKFGDTNYPNLVKLSSSLLIDFYKIFYRYQAKWSSVMLCDAAVQKHHLSNYVYTKFSQERPNGVPNYNLLVEQYYLFVVFGWVFYLTFLNLCIISNRAIEHVYTHRLLIEDFQLF